MTKQVWLPVDGAILKKLREDSGIEQSTLAKIYAVSNCHVKQLEEGGESSFYTPAIKLATGRKLLMHFGADVQPFKEKSAQQQMPELETPVVIPTNRFAITYSVILELVKNKKYMRFQYVGAGVLFLGFVILIFYFSKTQIEVKTVNQIAQSEPATPMVTSPVQAKAIEPITTPSKEVAFKGDKEISVECHWGKEPTTLIGNQPTKPGDYVHVVANMGGTICVKDAVSNLQVLQLKSAQSQTVRGRPPFEIFSHNLNEFKLFYQGHLLRLPRNDIKNITLKEQ